MRNATFSDNWRKEKFEDVSCSQKDPHEEHAKKHAAEERAEQNLLKVEADTEAYSLSEKEADKLADQEQLAAGAECAEAAAKPTKSNTLNAEQV